MLSLFVLCLVFIRSLNLSFVGAWGGPFTRTSPRWRRLLEPPLCLSSGEGRTEGLELSRTAEALWFSCCFGPAEMCMRCTMLIFMVVGFVLVTLHFYQSGLHSYANAAMATLVLTAAELGSKICHQQQVDMVEWLLALGLLAVGYLMLVLSQGSKDVAIAIIIGSVATFYKKVCLLLICRDEFREAFWRSLGNPLSCAAGDRSDASDSSDEEEPVALTSLLRV